MLRFQDGAEILPLVSRKKTLDTNLRDLRP